MPSRVSHTAPAWSEILGRLPLGPGDRVLMTGARADPDGWARAARNLGLDVVCMEVDAGGAAVDGLTHLLWWDPSVRAVLVEPGHPGEHGRGRRSRTPGDRPDRLGRAAGRR